MIKTYCKKPIPVKALQWTGTNVKEVKDFVGKDIEFIYPTLDDSVTIAVLHTLEGDMNVLLGAYIIQGVEGEFYACKEEVFNKTYEEVV